MLKKLIVFFVLFGFICSFAGTSLAQDQKRAYGWNLMTPEERTEHQNKMRSLKNEQEREQFRIEHHKKMQERAKEKGMTLPEKPRTPNKDGMGLGKKRGGGGGRGR